MSQGDTANFIYLVIALLVFGGAAFSASRQARAVGARGPGPMVSLLIWIAIIALVTGLYFGFQFWGGLFSALR